MLRANSGDLGDKVENMIDIEYSGIILIRGSQYWWIVKFSLVSEDVILCVTSFFAFQCKIVQYFVKFSWGRKFMG